MTKEEAKIYFFIDNKCGCKTTEKWLSKNQIELYLQIINNSIRKEIPFKEKIWLFINDLQNVPICPNCGKYLKFVETLAKGHNKYCSIDCLNSSEEHKSQVILFNRKKYGVDSHNQVNIIKEKKIIY